MKIRTYLLCILLPLIAACGKQGSSPGTDGKTAIDTTVKAEAVAIADTNHHLFFRPKSGTTRRYHVIDRMTATASDTQPNGQTTKHAATSANEFYVTETVGATSPDSSVSLTFRIDSISLVADQDSTHTHYSSNDPKDRANTKYSQFNIVIGKSVTVMATKYGDLANITDASSVANALMGEVPDSLRSNPRIKQMASQQAEEVVSAYLNRVLVHSPTRALIKDTTWRNTSDVNLNVAQGLSFPVTVNASETVRGLERRDTRILAILEDNTCLLYTSDAADE